MKSIFSEYGSVILAAILGIVIIGLFCQGDLGSNAGVATSLGALAQEQTKLFLEDHGEPEAFRAYMEYELPNVSPRMEPPVSAHEKIPVRECFVLTPENGQAQFRILSVVDGLGRTGTLVTEETTQMEYLYFEAPGRYEAHIELSVDGKRKEYRIIIPVVQKEGIG